MAPCHYRRLDLASMALLAQNFSGQLLESRVCGVRTCLLSRPVDSLKRFSVVSSLQKRTETGPAPGDGVRQTSCIYALNTGMHKLATFPHIGTGHREYETGAHCGQTLCAQGVMISVAFLR